MAAALVGGAFLSGALQVLFDRLAPKATIWDLFKTPNSNSKQLLKKLRNTLLFLSKLLDDAEKKEIIDPNVKAWLDELKDAVYEADDLLAEIAYDIHNATAVESASADGQPRRPLASLDDLSWEGTKFQEKLEQILERLAELKEEKDVLRLEDASQVDVSNLPLERRTTSLVDESEVRGREDDKVDITRFLMSEETNGIDGLGVIAIVGMGGLGKTTLAQLVYGQKEVSEQFQLKAWVCISEEIDVFLVTRNILKGFAPMVSGLDSMTPDHLQTKLKDILTEKRFLLVLDDVWDERLESWKILLKPLKHGLEGSRIIVTTRSTQVASFTSTAPSYPLKELTEDECWSVFERCAFKGEDPSAYPDLVAIGRKIVAKCGGLPLAANTLGNLLRTRRRDQTEWEWIMESEMWNLEDCNILPALSLSYHYLSSSLKRCFAYCALFPKDYEFEIDELVRLWMAAGLLDSHKTKRPMEEIGVDCFEALFSRSFFQKSSTNSSRFVMHDLIHDLAKSVAGDFYHRLENENAWLLPRKTRHLSYISTRYNTSQKFAGICWSKSLRSFLPIRSSIWHRDEYMASDIVEHLFEASKRLRILSLSNYINIKQIPESIGNLKLLRYLDLSRTSIIRLPDVVCKLCNLETLWLEKCKKLEEVPDSTVDLKCLHFLNLAGTAINKLPTNLCNLVNLCFLDISGTKLKEMPPKLGNLRRLQKLSDFFVEEGSSCSSIEELKELSKLKGELRIWNLQNVVHAQRAYGSNLKGKKNLKDLDLSWEGDDVDDSRHELKVLEGLEPPCTLEHLTVRGYRSTKFPDWVGHPLFLNLVSLRIEGCKNCYEMPPLGHMESLKQLYISECNGIVFVGLNFYGSPLPATDRPPFKSLEVLHFEGMPEWVTWERYDGAFPDLQELHLSNCPKLANALPGELPSLKKLRITGCDQLVAPSFPRAPAIVEVILQDITRGVHLFLGLHSSLDLSKTHKSSLDQMLVDIQRMGASIADLKELKIGHSDLASGYQGTESCSPLEGVLENFKCLDSLSINKCRKVVCFPKCELASPILTKLELFHLENLKSLPAQMKSVLPCLVDLRLLRCRELDSLPEGGLPSKLESLKISDCEKLMAGRKQWNLQALPSLSSLEVDGEGYTFDETESFPEATLLPPTLTTLVMGGLDGLKSLDYKGLQHLTSLQTLDIRQCSSLEKLLPEKEGLLPQSLATLVIQYCSSLEKLPEEGLPRFLTTLKISNLPNLKSLSPIQRFTSLGILSIMRCCDKVDSEEVALPSTITSLRVDGLKMESLDGWGLQRLTYLEELNIRYCDNIESITTEEAALPSSLRVVKLRNCPRVKSIQREGFPSSLERLVILECPLLAEKYAGEGEGEEWHSISSYFPVIRILR